MNSVKPNNQSLKYQRFTASGSKDIDVEIFHFVTKTQFLFSYSSIKVVISKTLDYSICFFIHAPVLKK